MIISDVQSNKFKFNKLIPLGIAIALLGLLYLISKPLSNSKTSKPYIADLKEYIILCDAEQVLDNNFITGEYSFSNGHTQSDEKAFSGKYSSKLPTGDGLQFGITLRLKKFNTDDLFKVSVWRLRPEGGDGALVVSADNKNKFYREENYPIEKNEAGWEKIEYFVHAPEGAKTLSIYTFSRGNAIMYFDDLKIERIIDQNTYQAETLSIQFRDKNLLKIENKRKEAIKAGILETADNDWVKAKLTSSKSKESIPIQLRLKGDWLDHLKGEKWSFRIKVKDPNSWNRLKTFSVQTPAAREFLSEWVLHKLWEKEDVLTPRYDFIKLQINGISRGTYVYEEHFEKQLVEYKNRREGPIIRLAEDGFWAAIKRQLEHVNANINYSLPQPEKNKENAIIIPFKEKQTFKNPTLTKEFEVAQTLLQQYVLKQKSAAEIFDVDRMAKYFAICDVMGAYHGIIWHNQRFYYNPVTSKLEPIGYDGFPIVDRFQSSFIGNGSLNKQFKNGRYLFSYLFLDKDFFQTYIQYLYKFSSKAYLNNFLQEIKPDLEKRLNLVKKEFPKYKFSTSNFVKRAQRIHLQLLPMNEVSIRAFRQKDLKANSLLKLSNLHGLPIEIIGTGLNKNDMRSTINPPLVLPGFQNQNIKDKYTDFQLESPANYLFYKTVGLDSIFYSKIINWKLAKQITPPQELKQNAKLSNNNSAYTLSEKEIFFLTGKHQINHNIIIPKDYKVSFQEGAELDFVNDASFISYSAINMLGTSKTPIKITSSDGTASGFTVLEAHKQSTLNYVIFEGFNTLDYKNWTLTGAVCFYESDVEIFNSIFKDNHCEDGLNIIRSKFLLENVLIKNTPFDGLDVDFGDGRITNAQFINIGNDGMDFSGSKIHIENCKIDHCGDKGISVGEESVAFVSKATIQNSNIAVASKDLSKLTIQEISIDNCQLGFTAYQKKPEFGGSKIIVIKYETNAVKRLYNIPQHNTLSLEGQVIKGN